MYEWVDWIKAGHIIAIISWMAGLLYLPRLFVYHCDAEPGSDKSETFKIMERRLLRAIMNPAMIVAWILGLWLAVLIEPWSEGWFHTKLLLVIGMTISHMAMAKWRKDFEADRNMRSHKYFRIANEIPTVFMLAIVILVVVKPF